MRSGETTERDIDIVFREPRGGGIEIEWVNVELVDGRRDVPGVQRRAAELSFKPAEDADFLLERVKYNPFTERDELTPISGDPLRWAILDENGLTVFSFAILDDGRYELQTYVRALDGDRLDLSFERIVEGELRRRISGWAYRAD